jgi:predicted RNA-binding Zn ribbon-like protein
MYDFDAGDLSLNFANTKDWHASQHPVENLNSYSDLVTWGQQAGLISAEIAAQLNQLAVDHPEVTVEMYEYAIQVREAIYRIFSYHYTNRPVLEADLSLLNNVACEAMSHFQLAPMGKSFEWKLPSDVVDVNLILWPVAHAAGELLTSERGNRVRRCEDDRGCGYLFIDQTKNHSRRWCSMESCGNRAKARRHYSRIQAN